MQVCWGKSCENVRERDCESGDVSELCVCERETSVTVISGMLELCEHVEYVYVRRCVSV